MYSPIDDKWSKFDGAYEKDGKLAVTIKEGQAYRADGKFIGYTGLDGKIYNSPASPLPENIVAEIDKTGIIRNLPQCQEIARKKLPEKPSFFRRLLLGLKL